MSRAVEIEVVVVAVTEKAICVNHGGPSNVWVPKSQISDFTGDGDEPDASTTSIFLPEWMAIDKGLV